MKEVRRELKERMSDITSYVDMLKFVERSGGTVTIRGRRGRSVRISQSTIHVMKAGVFLHLYNTVESTVLASLSYTANEIKRRGTPFKQLCDAWQKAWMRKFIKLENETTHDARLEHALRMCKHLVDGSVLEIVPAINGGNLDDRAIEAVAKKYGVQLNISAKVKTSVKRHVHNEQGFLGLVKHRRNTLAHGLDSFADIGRNYSVADLSRWSQATHSYLREVVACFDRYVKAKRFLRPANPP